MIITSGKPIFDIKAYSEALRYPEYKTIYSAAAEIIDNSIEAKAKNIYVLVQTKVNDKSGKKEIHKIGFLDDGVGMNPIELQECLTFGHSSKKSKEGIGRFGVGLKQASLFAAPRVEVYSWQENVQTKYVYLDTSEMKTGKQTEIPAPIHKEIPQEFSKQLLMMNKPKSGTFVLWINVDKCDVKQVSTLFDHMEETFGCMFRYFISKGLVIKLINCEYKGEERTVGVIDPLFIMDNCKYKADPNILGCLSETGESIFELFLEETINIEYFDELGISKQSPVKIRFSNVKSKFYGDYKAENPNLNPGDTQIGKLVKKYTGISIVRSNREVDYGNFDFFEVTNTPTHRWWGCEIVFTPELDKVFRISNNKQHVEMRKPKKDTTPEEYENNIWYKLSLIIEPTIKKIAVINKKAISNAIKGTNSGPKPEPQNHRNTLEDLIFEYANNKGIVFNNVVDKMSNLFDIDFDDSKTTVCNINENHNVYKKFFSNNDTRKTILKFILIFMCETGTDFQYQFDDIIFFNKMLDRFNKYMNEFSIKEKQ